MNILNDRMKMLGISRNELSEKSLVSKEIIDKLCANQIGWEDIHELDKNLIAHTLYCNLEYFSNEEVRKKDIVTNSFYRGEVCVDVNKIKAKIERLGKDYIYLKQLDLKYNKLESKARKKTK